MKAVIVETDGKYAAALTDDGQFIKIKNDNYSIGMTVVLEKENHDKKKTVSIFTVSIAAAAAIFLAVIGFKDFNTPYGVVSIDVNPSVEISVNRYDRVLDIEAVNDDAEEIVSQLNNEDMKYEKIDTVTDIIFDRFEEGSYETDDGTTFVVLSANSKNESYSEKLVERLESVSAEHEDINAQFVVADDELVERAKEAGTTAGKMYLVDQLRDSYGEKEINENEWISKPVKEIVREINVQNNDFSENMQNGQMPKPDESAMPLPENGEIFEEDHNSPKNEFNTETQENEIPENEKPTDVMPGQEERPEMKEEGKPGGPENYNGNNGNNPHDTDGPPNNERR